MLMGLHHIISISNVINNVQLISVFKLMDSMLHSFAKIAILIVKHVNLILINVLPAKII